MIKIGIIGLYDKGNGHPFSFSSIINGYSVKGYKKSNYHNILKYLQKKKNKRLWHKKYTSNSCLDTKL